MAVELAGIGKLAANLPSSKNMRHSRLAMAAQQSRYLRTNACNRADLPWFALWRTLSARMLMR